jgi:phage/plasmid-associated DNA primase
MIDFIKTHENDFCFIGCNITTKLVNGVEKKQLDYQRKWGETTLVTWKNDLAKNGNWCDNFAIKTGKISGITVIDFDTVEGYDDFCQDVPDLEEYFTVRTRKGYHVYCKYDSRFSTNTDVMDIIKGIDIRNDGGVIICPPSFYKCLDGTTATYEFLGGEIRDVPEFLFQNINPTKLVKEKLLLTPPATPHPYDTLTDEQTEILDNINHKYWSEYSTWRDLIWAIKNTFGSDAVEIAKVYSQKTNSNNYDEDAVLNKLDECNDSRISWGTVAFYSKESNLKNYEKIIGKYKKIKDDEIKKAGKELLLKSFDEENIEKDLLIQNFIYDGTDYGRAKLYLILIGDNFQYKDKIPYIYDGRLWKEDGEKEHLSLMKSIQDILIKCYGSKCKELTDLLMTTSPDNPELEKVKKNHKITLENLMSVKGQRAVVNCKAQVLIHAKKCEVNFDMVKPYYFVFKNKAFDFETGTEVKIEKTDYITQSVNYDYIDPTKTDIDEMMAVLKSSLPNDKSLKSLMSALRTACTGRRIQKFIMMSGGGRNGKGLINQLMKFLLQGYFYQGNINTITEKVKSGANPEVANMNKKRMVCFGEPEDNQQLMLGAIKALTGEDTINARGLFQSNTETNLQLTLFLEVNGKPNVCGKIGNAIQERFILYNFPNLFTDDETIIDNVTRFRQNKLYETTSWRERIRHALFHLLLNLRDDNDNIINDIFVSNDIKESTKTYLESKDELSNWIDDEYIIVDDKTFTDDKHKNIITMKDMFDKFKDSSLYNNSSKYVKRTKYSKKGFEDEMKENIKIKLYYVDDKTIDKIKIRNAFIRMRMKTNEEKDNCF